MKRKTIAAAWMQGLHVAEQVTALEPLLPVDLRAVIYAMLWSWQVDTHLAQKHYIDIVNAKRQLKFTE
jgi:hypothetical protein